MRLLLALLTLSILIPCARAEDVPAPPPGQRGEWTAETPCEEIQLKLDEVQRVRWLTEDRWQFILVRLDGAEDQVKGLTLKTEAQSEVIVAKDAELTAERTLSQARLDYATGLEADLDRTEKALTRSRKARRIWVWLGVIGAAFVAHEALD